MEIADGEQSGSESSELMKLEEDQIIKIASAVATKSPGSPEHSQSETSELNYKLMLREGGAVDQRNKIYLSGYLTGGRTVEKSGTNHKQTNNIRQFIVRDMLDDHSPH
jgi:hypothetical protein